MLEPMAAFFDLRLDGYEDHMLHNIEQAQAFYSFTADCLPAEPGAKVLDLGCGTGLELDFYFQKNSTASIVGIDLAPGMLAMLGKKFPDKNVELHLGSYFEVPFDVVAYNAAVSVESLHHFTKEEKITLYCRLKAALKPNGYFILTDYFSCSDDEEAGFREKLLQLQKEQGGPDGQIYHFNTPLTVEHEMEALLEAGFSQVEVLGSWGATTVLRAHP